MRSLGRTERGFAWLALGIWLATWTGGNANERVVGGHEVVSTAVTTAPDSGHHACGAWGWTMYWYDPWQEDDPCHCKLGEWTCPDAEPARIYFAAEFLPMFRDQLNSAVFQARSIELVSGGTTTFARRAVLTADDFDNQFDPGIRVTVGVAIGDFWRLEGGYVGNYAWNDSAEVRYVNDGSGNLLSPFSSFGDSQQRPGLATLSSADYAPVTGLDFNDLARIAFTSELQTGEINIRRRLSDVSTRRVAAESSLLLGVRHLKLTETFDYFTNSPLPVANTQNRANVLADNDLFGVQIGGMAQFMVGSRSWIDLEFKGSMLFGTAENEFQAQIPVSAGPPSGPFRQSADVTAFLGDLSLQYNYQLAPSVILKAGYNAFFLSGVSLATDNFDANVTSLLTGPGTLDHDGRIVYHGPSVGLVFVH